jgi:hypothetical protein
MWNLKVGWLSWIWTTEHLHPKSESWKPKRFWKPHRIFKPRLAKSIKTPTSTFFSLWKAESLLFFLFHFYNSHGWSKWMDQPLVHGLTVFVSCLGTYLWRRRKLCALRTREATAIGETTQICHPTTHSRAYAWWTRWRRNICPGSLEHESFGSNGWTKETQSDTR